MIKKLKKNKFFSEKGSVTLFILISIIFFLIISLNVYSSNKNKIIAQKEEIQAIEENYNKDLDKMDEIYENLVEADLKTVFIKESSINTSNKIYYNLSEWTNENVVVNVTVNYGNDTNEQLQVKVTSKRTGATITYNQNQINNNEVIITENSTVVVIFGNKQQKFELNKFDKEIPVLSYESFYNKNDVKHISGKWTNKETYTKLSVKEEISGISEMYYSTDKQNWTKLNFAKSNGIYEELNTYCGKETWALKDGRVEDIYFRAKDRAGNYSNISNVYQLRYDLTAPTKPIIENEYNDIWTNKDVEIIAKSSDSLSKIAKIEYSYDEIDWKSDWKEALQNNGDEASISGKWDNSFNGKIYVRAIDNAGNISETSYTTLKQDIIPPTVNITPNGNTYYVPEGGKTTIKAKLDAADNESGLHILEYAWSTSNTVEPSKWETFENGTEITKNNATSGIYYLWTNVIDNVGNRAMKIKVSNPFVVSSDESEAFKITIIATPTNWTNKDVNVTITYGYGLTQGKKAGIGISIAEAQKVASESTANQLTVTKNNYYVYAEAIDSDGNKVTATRQITIIDKIEPSVELGTNGGTYTIAPNSDSAQITTKITAQDNGGSGLNNLQYQISSSTTLPTDDDPNWKTFTNGSTVTENKTGGTWYLYTKVTDKAGNRANHIQKSDPYVVNYSVTYDENGGTGSMPTDTVSYGSSYITRENKFTRIGYDFIGWNETPDGTGKDWTSYIGKPLAWSYNKSITLYAQWKAKTYTVTYNANGGTGSMAADTVAYNDSYITKGNSFSNTGYAFVGWNESPDGTGKDWTSYIGKTVTWTYTKDITLYAQWKIGSYTLTVDPNGGTWNGTTQNSMIVQDAGSTKNIENPIPPLGNIITFNGNGGSTPSTQTSTKSFTSWSNSGAGSLSGTTYTFGAGDGTLTANYRDNSITLPSSSRTGYTFEGWYDSAYGGSKIGDAGDWYTPTSSKILYAHWTANQYTLTVNPNGGSWNGSYYNSTFTQGYGTTRTISNPIAPSGNTVYFNGNGGSTPSSQTSTKSFTSWSNSGAGSLSGTTYTFGAGDGTLTANYRDNSITLPSSSRTGYTFEGWYDSAYGGSKIGDAGDWYTPTSSKILYAHWTANQYTLTVNPNGGSWNGSYYNSTFTQGYGTTRTISNPIAPSGNTVYFEGNGGSTPSAKTSTKSFTSWSNSGAGSLSGTTYIFGAGDGTLTANYETNSITLPSTSRTGYTFEGWYDSAYGGSKIGDAGDWYTPTSSKTLYAHWTANQYTLTVNPNGGSWNGSYYNSTFTQSYGTTRTISNPIPPSGNTVYFDGNGGSNPSVKTSTKSFTSWSNSGAGSLSGTTYTFGAGDGTLTANYRDNSITLPSSSRTGYTFEGWYDSAYGGSKIGDAGDWYTPTSSKTLYAHWTANQYTLTVNPNGGSWNGSYYNSTFRQSYGTTKTISNPIPPSGNTVYFEGNGGSTPSSQTSTKSFTSWSNSGAGSFSGTTYTFGLGDGTLTANYRDNSIVLPSTSRTGYTFAGWYDSAYGGSKIGDAGTWYTPTSSITLYAHWSAKEYTLTVNPNGGSWNGSYYNSTFKQTSGTTKTITNPIPPSGGNTVYFDGNGGSTPSSITATKRFTYWTNSGAGSLSGTTYTFGMGDGTLTANYETNSITLPSTSREGYEFLGWYDSSYGGNRIGDAGESYTPTSSKTLYAQWRVKTLQITFVRNTSSTDNVSTTQTFTYGVPNQSFSDKGWSNSGYKLLGWHKDRYSKVEEYRNLSSVEDWFIDKYAPSLTIYAIWAPDPQITITKQPANQTVVDGNEYSFSISTQGTGQVTYQWYMSETSSSTSGWKPVNATGTVCKYTANMGLNGRYFYCEVTATIDGVSKTVKSNTARLTVQTANYSTVKSGVTTYYYTLNQAFTGATSGGGDNGGGTITVLNSLTDNTVANTNKTITLNTNGKTITRDKHIGTTGGTLSIKGGGTISNNNSTDADASNAVVARGGNLTISGGTRLQAQRNAINMSTGNLTIGSGYFYGIKGDAIVYGGGSWTSGSVSINTARIYAPRRNLQAIRLQTGKYNVTINDTWMGNGSSNATGKYGNGTDEQSALCIYNSGTVTTNGSTRIYGGPYGGHPIGRYTSGTTNFLGDTYVYATYSGADGKHCLWNGASGIKTTFNSTGRFFSTGYGVADSEVATSYTITKGHFAAQRSKYMFYSSSSALTGYVGSSSTQNYYWMTSLTDTTLKSLSCYYYKKGV